MKIFLAGDANISKIKDGTRFPSPPIWTWMMREKVHIICQSIHMKISKPQRSIWRRFDIGTIELFFFRLHFALNFFYAYC